MSMGICCMAHMVLQRKIICTVLCMSILYQFFDRTVGWGTVPDEYNSELPINNTDGQDSKRSEKTREEVLRTTKTT